jgi:cell division septation protein DedD
MTKDTNNTSTDGEEQAGFEAKEFVDTDRPRERREPVFSMFDGEEDYEEPERDTDYASRYIDDDDIEDAPDLTDETDDLDLDWEDDNETPRAASGLDEEEETPWEPDEEADELAADADTDERPPWESGESEDDYDNDYAEESSSWPLGMVAVGLVAIILLAAGGYGVLQQRAATAEEIRQLRAQLATATRPAEVKVDNAALSEARKENIELSMAMDSLKLENQRLTDTVAGLEAQLDAQQAALAMRPTPTPKPAPKPAPKPVAPKPAPAETASNAPAAGGWFVNFGSYSQRATAESWAGKLKPASGRATVTTGSRDGKTFYRVRVVELSDKAAAEGVARQLESEHGLSKLWVGK